MVWPHATGKLHSVDTRARGWCSGGAPLRLLPILGKDAQRRMLVSTGLVKGAEAIETRRVMP